LNYCDDFIPVESSKQFFSHLEFRPDIRSNLTNM